MLYIKVWKISCNCRDEEWIKFWPSMFYDPQNVSRQSQLLLIK